MYSNSAYGYAISPIALVLFRGKGFREIATSQPLSMVFTILSHCRNTTAVRNYFVRSEGQLFGLDAMLKESFPLSPLESFPYGETGPNPRLAKGISPTSLYLLLYGSVLQTLQTLRFGEMSRGRRRAREIGRFRFLRPISKTRLRNCLFSAFARTVGPSAEIDVEKRNSTGFDLKREVLEGRPEVLTGKDCLPLYCASSSKRTSYFYIQFSGGIGRELRKSGPRTSTQGLASNDLQMYHRYLRNSYEGGRTEVVWVDLSTARKRSTNGFYYG